MEGTRGRSEYVVPCPVLVGSWIVNLESGHELAKPGSFLVVCSHKRVHRGYSQWPLGMCGLKTTQMLAVVITLERVPSTSTEVG